MVTRREMRKSFPDGQRERETDDCSQNSIDHKESSDDNIYYNALFVLTLLVHVSFVFALPREEKRFPSAFVQRNQKVRAKIAVG